MQAQILIAEDETALVTTLRDRLRKEHYEVTIAKNGDTALDLATKGSFDLLILDVMLPGRSGLHVCEALRQLGKTTPILMLTARRQLGDKLAGLNAGADDYLIKPFEMVELLARIEALLRRAGSGRGVPYVFDDVRIDFQRTEVLRDGRTVTLSAMEFQLLRYFVERRGNAISREDLLKEVWGYQAVLDSRTVDVHVAGLRQKLEKDPKSPRFILTVAGVGYKFAEEPDASLSEK